MDLVYSERYLLENDNFGFGWTIGFNLLFIAIERLQV